MERHQPPPVMPRHPDELVALFADKHQRNAAITELIGGLTAAESRHVKLTDPVFDALVRGLGHRNPKVRWWCLQIFDHVGDERCVPYVAKALDDPVHRVANHNRHVSECKTCKQSCLAAQAVKAAFAGHREIHGSGAVKSAESDDTPAKPNRNL